MSDEVTLKLSAEVDPSAAALLKNLQAVLANLVALAPSTPEFCKAADGLLAIADAVHQWPLVKAYATRSDAA